MDIFGGENSTTVGFSGLFDKISYDLVRGSSELRYMSLFGMAGIGKTHLARQVYQSQLIVEHFDRRAWVTVGPKFDIERVLPDILAQIEPNQSINLSMEEDVESRIYAHLCGQRYFIVLDAIWSNDWFELRNCFPTYKSGSRILLTTRIEIVARYSKYLPRVIIYQMHLLSHEESWELLRHKAFGEEMSPSELEDAGREIAAQCEGLPLLILEVAKLLSGDEMNLDYWNAVAKKQNTVFTDAYTTISKVLFLSYEYLPQHLKPYFLYMGAFPENYEVPVSRLSKLWMVEDILNPNESPTGEDFRSNFWLHIEAFSGDCLRELVFYSLVIVCKHSSQGSIKSCKLHSSYWPLCVAEARKNKFLHVLNSYADCAQEYLASQQRLSIQNNVLFGISKLHSSMAAANPEARSLLYTGPYHEYPVPMCFGLVLLKVLDALAIRFYEFPVQVLNLLELKYLALTYYGSFPSSISSLRELQSLTVSQHQEIDSPRDSTYFPQEIWDMQDLVHLRIPGSNLPNPINYAAQLPKLMTLHVQGHSCTEYVFTGVRKLKKLGIKIQLQSEFEQLPNWFRHIHILEELESLTCDVVSPRLRSRGVVPYIWFPACLRKLSLNGTGFPWDSIFAIGRLLHLEVLKLRLSAFSGPEWITEIYQFRQLKFLLLEDMDLVL